MGIGQLGDNLNDFKNKGPKDIKLSTEARDKYVSLVTNFKADIEAQRKKIAALPEWRGVGNYASALQVRTLLTGDVTDPGGVIDQLQKYEDYLDIAAATIKKAADRLIDNG